MKCYEKCPECESDDVSLVQGGYLCNGCEARLVKSDSGLFAVTDFLSKSPLEIMKTATATEDIILGDLIIVDGDACRLRTQSDDGEQWFAAMNHAKAGEVVHYAGSGTVFDVEKPDSAVYANDNYVALRVFNPSDESKDDGVSIIGVKLTQRGDV